MQLGMAFNSLVAPGSGTDIEHISITIAHPLDTERFMHAWQCTVARYEVLHSRFDLGASRDPKAGKRATPASTSDSYLGQTSSEGARFEPGLVPTPEFVLAVNHLDWSGETADYLESLKAGVMREDRELGFDLSAAPPMRLTIAKHSQDSYWILWSFHHALLDGRSFPTVLGTVFELYDSDADIGRDDGREIGGNNDSSSNDSSSSVDRGFREFSAYLNGKDCSADVESWERRLAGYERSLGFKTLPVVYSLSDGLPGNFTNRLYAPTHAFSATTLTREQQSSLLQVAADSGCSLNNLIQAAWALLLMHHNSVDDVVFGTTRALRHAHPPSQDAVGLLINTVPFRVKVGNDTVLSDLLAQVKREQTDLRQLETTPLSSIQAALPDFDGPLFDTMVMFDSRTLDQRMSDGGLTDKNSRCFDYQGQTNFPVTLVAYGTPDIALNIEYDTTLLDVATGDLLLQQLCALLANFEHHLATPALSVPYLDDAEQLVLAQWNATDEAYETGLTLQQLFERQVVQTPNAPALGFDQKTLDYLTFNKQVNKLAHYLREKGVTRDSLVGIYLDRSFELLIAIYAIVKAGGAYVPFEVGAPAGRMQFMIDDADADLLLTQNHLLDDVSMIGRAEVISVDDNNAWAGYPDSNPDLINDCSDVAYMLYTSGSTGNPKGVLNEHRGIVNRLQWMQQAFALDANDAVMQKTPITFDVSVWELFWPLQVGATLSICAPDDHKDAHRLTEIVQQQNITTLHFVPSMLQLFLEDPAARLCSGLKKIICSGEALPKSLQDKVFSVLPSVELHNLYGPTEAAIDVTWWQCDKSSNLDFIPIGKPVANTQIHILDSQLNPMPVGVTGELHIAGVQVARGYHKRPELTRERFIDNPFDPSYKMYKSGDLARYLADGNIEYLGRVDFQVKLRGQRLELGEIESVLTSDDSVREAVVSVVTDPAGEQALAAYLTGRQIDLQQLENHCSSLLSSYMIPTEWVILDSMPLNSSGKVDRKTLPAPLFDSHTGPTDQQSTLAGNDDDDVATIVSIWQDILGRQDIRPDQSFFDAGGNSRLIMRLALQLSQSFGREVSVRDVMREVTVAQQASFVSDERLIGGGDIKIEAPSLGDIADPGTKAADSRIEEQRVVDQQAKRLSARNRRKTRSSRAMLDD